MSRIGKKLITIPNGVKVDFKDHNATVVGPKGTIVVAVHPKVEVKIDGSELVIDVAHKDNKLEKSLWGLTRALIANAVSGVVTPFEKKLEINGVAYRAALAGTKITLSLGFSHPIEVQVPVGLAVVIDKNLITITGIDKQLVGEFAANIRSLKKPEPYKGKGIRYIDEVVRRKAGKVMKAVGGGK